jgi:hypothetical protein
MVFFSCFPQRLTAMTEPKFKAAKICAPLWWPFNGKTPISYLYRSMRVDWDDLVDRYGPEREYASDDYRLRSLVIRAVAKGSSVRSPFLHASTSISAAHRYSLMGQACRSEEADRQVFVRIDIWSWSQSGTLTRDMIIDLSTIKAQKVFSRMVRMLMAHMSPSISVR